MATGHSILLKPLRCFLIEPGLLQSMIPDIFFNDMEANVLLKILTAELFNDS